MGFIPVRFSAAFLFLGLSAGCGSNLKETGRNADDALRDIWEPVAGIFTGNSGSGKRPDAPRPSKDLPQFALSVDRYENCSALQADIRERLAQRREDERRYQQYLAEMDDYWSSSGYQQKSSASAGTVSEDMASGADDSSSDESYTNTQERGVDEADEFKIGRHHIFTPGDKSVQVITRVGLTPMGALDMTGIASPLYYSDGDRFIVVGRKEDPEQKPCTTGYGLKSVSSSSVYSCGRNELTTNPVTIVRFYDGSDPGKLPALYLSKEIKGTVYDTRFINGHLILVQNDYMWVKDPAFKRWSDDGHYYLPHSWPYSNGDLLTPVPEQPVVQADDKSVQGVPCDRIMRQTVSDFDFRMTKVISINSRAPGAPEQITAVLGGGDSIYMSTDNLYVIKANLEWYYWDSNFSRYGYQQLAITKLAMDAEKGTVMPVAAGTVTGRIKDQWAFKDFPQTGALAVATTTGNLWSKGDDIAQNHLWILKNQTGSAALETVASVRDFGTGEDIKAIRYVSNMAYVVTFKKTDPLYAIDMSNPLDPKMLGELKVPGFSVYMHPVAPGRLVGVGFDAADMGEFAWYLGVQVSLFDVSNPAEMKRIDNKILGERGSSSEITSDHKAFFYDQASGLMAVPATELTGSRPGSGVYAEALAFSGAVIYKVGDSLNEVARITHSDLIPEGCRKQLAEGRWWQDGRKSLDINRVFLVDGKLLSMSAFGIKAHDPINPALVLATIHYGNTSRCGRYYY